jgi:hypothetical protein
VIHYFWNTGDYPQLKCKSVFPAKVGLRQVATHFGSASQLETLEHEEATPVRVASVLHEISTDV